MNDLRSEIRAEFEREQSAFPPPGHLRPRFVHAVSSQAQARPHVQLAAAFAVLLMAALIVAALVLARPALVPTTPAATPAATRDYGPPPAGVPLFYVGDPRHPGWYTGFDWNGVPRGTIKLTQPLGDASNLVQAPDGSGFFSSGKVPDDSGQTLDRLGKAQTSFPVPIGIRQLIWADDSRHLCSVAFQNGNLWLSWHVPSFSQNVTVVAKEPDPARGIGGDIGLVACSFQTDQRAILVRDYGLRPTEYWVVGLGDGRVRAHANVPVGIINVVGSSDGQYLAENASSAKATRIVELSTGNATEIDPSLSVLEFSGDDKTVVVTPGWSAGFPTVLEGIELATGKVLWRYDGGEELAAFPLAEPGGGSFELTLKQAGDQALHAPIHVLIEHADGTSTAVPGTFTRP